MFVALDQLVSEIAIDVSYQMKRAGSLLPGLLRLTEVRLNSTHVPCSNDKCYEDCNGCRHRRCHRDDGPRGYRNRLRRQRGEPHNRGDDRATGKLDSEI
ncbi:MAG TPA: hypothetical protein VGJ78_04580 [Vicinamibacterales bacterium]